MTRIETVKIIYATCERQRCRWEWKTRGTVPAVCPKCKSRLWNKSGVVERDGFQETQMRRLAEDFRSMPEFHIGPRITRGRVDE